MVINNKVGATIEIVHDIHYIFLKALVNKTIPIGSSITLKNINGVWYEI